MLTKPSPQYRLLYSEIRLHSQICQNTYERDAPLGLQCKVKDRLHQDHRSEYLLPGRVQADFSLLVSNYEKIHMTLTTFTAGLYGK